MLKLARSASRALALIVIAAPAASQTEFAVRTPLNARIVFADPLYWLNATPDERLPIIERPLSRQPGFTTPAPPPLRRNGWTPWIGTALELNNSAKGGAGLLTLTPGVHFSTSTRRLQFAADYAVEGALKSSGGSVKGLVQAHGGSARLSFTPGPNGRFTILEVFSDTRDTRAAPVQGALGNASRLVFNDLVAGYSAAISPRQAIEFDYRNSLRRTVGGTAPDIMEHAISGRYQYRLSETARLSADIKAVVTRFDAAGDENLVSAGATYTRAVGPRLAISGGFGLTRSSEAGGETVARLGASVIASSPFARYELRASRDITSVPGLADLALSEEIRGSARIRVDRGMILDMEAGLQRLGVYDAAQTEIVTASLGGQISYALRKDLWLWGRVELNRERTTGGAVQTDNRLTVGLTVNLDR